MKHFYLFSLLIVFTISNYAQTFTNLNAPIPDLSTSFTALGDVDNDGDLDMYISGEKPDTSLGGGLYIFDSGNYTLSTTAALPLLSLGSSTFGDVDNDGDLDLLLQGYDPSGIGFTDIYLNNNDGTFTALNAGFDPTFSGDATMVDINNDTYLDIAITGMETNTWTYITKIYKNNGDNTFTELALSLPGMNFGRIKFADYNNDGYKDFVLNGLGGADDSFYTKIFNNNGDETFTESGIELTQLWIGDMEWGDYNADGNIDLVISGTGGDGTERSTTIYKNNGDGTFSDIDATTSITGVSHSSLEWADFDNDNDLDLLVLGTADTPGNGVYVYTIFNNMGSDSFVESTTTDFAGSYYGDAKVGDIDGDSKMDIVITGYDENDNKASNVYMNSTVAGINSSIFNTTTVYPNPTSDKLTINSNLDNLEISLFSTLGQKVYQSNGNIKNIDVSLFDSGVYLLKIASGDHTISKKIIIE